MSRVLVEVGKSIRNVAVSKQMPIFHVEENGHFAFSIVFFREEMI